VSWISGLSIVVAVLVCVGLMAHATSIDADSTVVAATSIALSDAQHSAVTTDLSPGDTSMGLSAVEMELCAFLGVMCALMLLVVRTLSGAPPRTETLQHRAAPKPLLATTAGAPRVAAVPQLLTPLRV
jgi:hypothetical protein